MKRISLPITQTVSATIDLQRIDPSAIVDLGDGKKALHFGQLINPDISEIMDAARANGGLLLYATTSIEKHIEDILLLYFMGSLVDPDEKRDLFKREVLESSALSFHSKKELLAKVVNEADVLPGKRKNYLQSKLKSIMDWRNAFAHGKVQHDTVKGCFLRYYSGRTQELILNDEYWDAVEEVFRDTDSILTEIKRLLREKVATDGRA